MAEAGARVAVIGGGWAGCAAAVTLAAKGYPVTLFEQGPTLGGRARRVVHEGMALDNGQHLLLGAYHQTIELLSLVHGSERAATLFHRLPLTLQTFGENSNKRLRLTSRHLPAPLHLAAGVLSARGLSIGERFALLSDFRRLQRDGFERPASETVAECFASSSKRVYEEIWSPLCLSALNTPASYASSAIFAKVLGAALSGSKSNSDFLVPSGDLSASFPDAAAAFIERNGGIVRKGRNVRGLARYVDGIMLEAGATPEPFSAAIIAVGPHQLAATLGRSAETTETFRGLIAKVQKFAYESITTIYVAFAAPIRLPVPMMRLDDAPGQWVFDRSAALANNATQRANGLLAVVISGSGPHDALDHAALVRASIAQLRRLSPTLPEVAWTRVISERRATYACKPSLARPGWGTLAPGIYLAGDYTDPEFPATLEAAMRSGVAAARAVFASRTTNVPK